MNIDAIRLLIRCVEKFKDALFLPEIFGNRNSADRLLDGLIDFRHGDHAVTRDAARQVTINRGQAQHERDKSTHQQCHVPFGVEHHYTEDQRSGKLRRNVRNDHNKLAEIIGIRCDARDNASRRKLIIKREIMFGRGVECLCA